MTEFLQAAMQSPLALLLMVFLMAAVESLVVVGLLVPGIAGLVALTLAAASAGVGPGWWWLAGALGAMAGDASGRAAAVWGVPDAAYNCCGVVNICPPGAATATPALVGTISWLLAAMSDDGEESSFTPPA